MEFPIARRARLVSVGIGSMRGDGKVFPTALIASEVSIPDQRAILCWANGEERLVIETRFAGEGTEFAWVVPLPSVPRIEPATIGVLRTLDFLSKPELRHEVTPVWRWILLGVGGWDRFFWASVPALVLLGVVSLFRLGFVQTGVSATLIVLFWP